MCLLEREHLNRTFSHTRRHTQNMTRPSITIQITPDSRPTTPPWMGEVAAFAQVFTHTGILQTIHEQVRFARARFGQYEVIDLVAASLVKILSFQAHRLSS